MPKTSFQSHTFSLTELPLLKHMDTSKLTHQIETKPNARSCTFEYTLKQRGIQLVGLLLRFEHNDPTRAITPQPNTAKSTTIHKSR